MEIVMLAALLLYLPLWVRVREFVHDDVEVSGRQDQFHMAHLLSTKGLTKWSYAICRGQGPRFWLAVNLACHAMASVLVFQVAALLMDGESALMAGVLFAVHPMGVEAVALSAGRASVLTAIGLLMLVLGIFWGSLGVATLGSVVALLAKEEGLSALGLSAALSLI